MKKSDAETITKRFDGLQRRSTELLMLIDRYLDECHFTPSFKHIRHEYPLPEFTESSIWAWLFELERCGSIELARSYRAPEIRRRVAA
jgi:hypothetical protein